LRTVAKDIFAAVDYKIAKEWKRRWADLERNILMYCALLISTMKYLVDSINCVLTLSRLQLFLTACAPFNPTAESAIEYTNFISKSARTQWQQQQREVKMSLMHNKTLLIYLEYFQYVLDCYSD
jgi:hypothetical protein